MISTTLYILSLATLSIAQSSVVSLILPLATPQNFSASIAGSVCPILLCPKYSLVDCSTGLDSDNLHNPVSSGYLVQLEPSDRILQQLL